MFTHDDKSNINVRRFCLISECGQKMTEKSYDNEFDTRNFKIPIRLPVINEYKIPLQEHWFLQ